MAADAISIRRPTMADVAAIVTHVGDPAVFGGLLQMPYPTEAAWRQRLEDTMKLGATDLMLVAERDGELVGLAGLHGAGTSPRRAHARTLGLWVVPHAHRQGVGSALMQALVDVADRWIGALRLELTVNADNAAAIALYRRFGFELEGTHRGYTLRDGVLVDCHAMARWNPQPPTRPGA
ncbi:MAG: GNAT family N-acetyltransferase [Inhella sp.]|jgi:putative acetyltransferase|uniref:GNAT family N-acetyltransferase n=1 Tax=Inhella sp. TaxID=1921806 RepID=UPI0022C6C383|nr:GNAT family N-acetyltransferase [Inhella sp.]MCZ8236286.1 GNAT family N-acetyltransferase [Inhella sp.]